MAQSYTFIECILVDDVSTDDTISKCEEVIANYNGPIAFRILNSGINQGSSASRNKGTHAATGDYLFYIDSDDEITPNCIEKMVSYVIGDDSIEMVQGNYLRICGNDKELGRSVDIIVSSNDEARNLFFTNRILNEFIWNKLLKRSFIIDNDLFNKEGIINQDLLWMYYLTKCLSKAILLEDVTYYYRIRPGSIVTGSSKIKQGHSYVIIYDNILSNLTKGKEKGELYGFLYNFCYQIISYKKYVPQLEPVYREYKRSVKEYGTWYYSLVLSFANMLSRLGIPPYFLQTLNIWRHRLKKGYSK